MFRVKKFNIEIRYFEHKKIPGEKIGVLLKTPVLIPWVLKNRLNNFCSVGRKSPNDQSFSVYNSRISTN